MQKLLYALVLLFSTACGVEQNVAVNHESLPAPELEVYQRALAYGAQIDLNPIDADIEKNLQLRLYRIPIAKNDCFVETHGICQYEYLLSVSSFDEQPEVNVFKLPLVGEMSRIGWRKHSGIDEAVIEVSLNRYTETALKNNPALRNATSQHVLIVNLKTVTVAAVNH